MFPFWDLTDRCGPVYVLLPRTIIFYSLLQKHWLRDRKRGLIFHMHCHLIFPDLVPKEINRSRGKVRP